MTYQANTTNHKLNVTEAQLAAHMHFNATGHWPGQRRGFALIAVALAAGVGIGVYGRDVQQAPIQQARADNARQQGRQDGLRQAQPTIQAKAEQQGEVRGRKAATLQADRSRQVLTRQFEQQLGKVRTQLDAATHGREQAMKGWKSAIAEGNAKLSQQGRRIAVLERRTKCLQTYKLNSQSVGWGVYKVVRAIKANCG